MSNSNQSKNGFSIKETVTLIGINIIVLFRNMIEFIKVAFRYYGCIAFLKEDIALRLMYLFHNPYSISKRFLIKKGKTDIYAYGETPLTTLELIARQCGIGPSDCVYELGAGRGRGCFWLHSFIGCSVVGLEFVPDFVDRANRITKRLALSNIEFKLANFCKSDFKGASVCYLYGTCLEDGDIKALIEKFSKLPAGTKIITVSYPLSDYAEKPYFEIMKHFTAPFTWGEADVYVQVVRA